jgi:hypothetical protein
MSLPELSVGRFLRDLCLYISREMQQAGSVASSTLAGLGREENGAEK